MDSKPSLFQVKSEIQHYDSIEQDIDDITPVIVTKSTELSTGKVAIICVRVQLHHFNHFIRKKTKDIVIHSLILIKHNKLAHYIYFIF